MSEFLVYNKPDAIQKHFSNSPYNIKNDTKHMKKEELDDIANQIADLLQYRLNHPKVLAFEHWDKSRRAGWAKIRVVDIKSDKGKSSGYRCIVLVDTIRKFAFLLHIYKHGSPKNDGIDKKSKNKLNRIVDEYVESVLKYNL